MRNSHLVFMFFEFFHWSAGYGGYDSPPNNYYHPLHHQLPVHHPQHAQHPQHNQHHHGLPPEAQQAPPIPPGGLQPLPQPPKLDSVKCEYNQYCVKSDVTLQNEAVSPLRGEEEQRASPRHAQESGGRASPSRQTSPLKRHTLRYVQNHSR